MGGAAAGRAVADGIASLQAGADRLRATPNQCLPLLAAAL
jgi:hypothetical protein